MGQAAATGQAAASEKQLAVGLVGAGASAGGVDLSVARLEEEEEEDGEVDVFFEVARLGEDGEVDVHDLQEALQEERQRHAEKAAEVGEMGRLLSALEATIERQAESALLDQQHLCRLEDAMEKSRGGQDVEGLLAKVAGLEEALGQVRGAQEEEEAAQARRSLPAASEGVLRPTPQAEEAREKAEGRQSDLQGRAKEEGRSSCTRSTSREAELEACVAERDRQLSALRALLQEEQAVRQDLEERLRERDASLKELADKEDAHRDPVVVERQVCRLQEELADELKKRQKVQAQVIEMERQVCDLQDFVAETMRREMPGRSSRSFCEPGEDSNYFSTGTPLLGHREEWRMPARSSAGRGGFPGMPKGMYRVDSDYEQEHEVVSRLPHGLSGQACASRRPLGGGACHRASAYTGTPYVGMPPPVVPRQVLTTQDSFPRQVHYSEHASVLRRISLSTRSFT